jgi:hypothetical protein
MLRLPPGHQNLELGDRDFLVPYRTSKKIRVEKSGVIPPLASSIR